MIRQRDKKKKCICKDCNNCHHYRDWDVTDQNGLRTIEKGCSIDVLSDTLPKLIGSIDGCQRASNETRNDVLKFGVFVGNKLLGEKCIKTIEK